MALHIFNFDGTGNEPEDALQAVKKGKKEDDNITNILKFHFMAGGNLHDDEKKGLSTHSKVENCFYYQGVGTYGNWWSRLINQGISPEKKDVGTILIKAIKDFNRVYQKGDQVIVTGFSRGAALARRFCSKIIEESPLLNKQTTPFIYLAAFDTVASIGLPNLSKAERPDYDVVFEDGHTISKIIKQATHLVSLDDKRKAFQPTLMNYEESRITELWFAGAHSDVGGGYYRDGLSDVTLSYLINWITYQVKMFDLLDPELKMPSEKALQKALPLRLKNIIGLDDLQREANALGKNHQQDRWPIVDWLTLEDRVCCVIDKDKLSSKHKPVIHNSITERIAFDKDYRPKSLANVSHNVFFAFKNEPINGFGVKAYCNNPRPVWFALEVGESIEAARVDGLNDVVKKLKKDERDIKTSLRAVEVALEALAMFGTEGVEAEELLVEAKRERSQLTAQLKRIRRKKGQVDVQRNRLANVDSGKRVKDVRKIVPIVTRESDEEHARESDMEHIDVERAEMPRVGRVGRERSDGVDAVETRPKLRHRRVRVIRRLKRGKVTRKLSTRFLKKLMEYRARRERLAREVGRGVER